MAGLGRSCDGFALQSNLEFALSYQPMAGSPQSAGQWWSSGRLPAFGGLRPRAAMLAAAAPGALGLPTVLDPLL
jgi:hypothetical protein